MSFANYHRKTLVLFTSLFRDGAGELYVAHNVVPLVSAAANAPLYGFIDQYIGRGIVGGAFTVCAGTAMRRRNWYCRFWQILGLAGLL